MVSRFDLIVLPSMETFRLPRYTLFSNVIFRPLRVILGEQSSILALRILSLQPISKYFDGFVVSCFDWKWQPGYLPCGPEWKSDQSYQIVGGWEEHVGASLRDETANVNLVSLVRSSSIPHSWLRDKAALIPFTR